MSLARGACPTLFQPMQTGDGLLARLNPVGGALNGRQLAGLAQAAKRFGNGIIEITARGSLQIRGLTEESTGGLAAEVESLGIAVRSGLPIDTNPLAGRDSEEVADPRDLAREIAERAAALGLSERLGPKVSVTVDGGGALGLGGITADVKLEGMAQSFADTVEVDSSRSGGVPPSPTRFAGHLSPASGGEEGRAGIAAGDSSPPLWGRGAERMRGGEGVTRHKNIRSNENETVRGSGGGNTGHCASNITWVIRVGGTSATARVLGHFSQDNAVETTVRILRAIAERGLNARARDLSESDLAAITGRGSSPTAARTEPTRPPVGRYALCDGKQAQGVALAYGQIESEALAGFAQSIGEIRLAPGRGLIVLDVAGGEETALLAAAERAGLVTEPADPRLAIATCAGSPACASAHLATKRLADRLVARRPDLARQSPVHISGCEKQCARPSGPVISLLGSGEGYRIVNDGADPAPDLKALLVELAEEERASTQGQHS
ncbi:hypothetical protein [Chelativorans sp. YIM 93263]|uniref:hypothetical protein n=1 Tax=Chelativorans sp. YIM 93263 TaxID=2906648 RepID=UPI00237823E6|nr:hypothetical protein [Chelativorans sp. YIM 93263]